MLRKANAHITYSYHQYTDLHIGMNHLQLLFLKILMIPIGVFCFENTLDIVLIKEIFLKCLKK